MKTLFRLSLLIAPLMLSACGEGWEARLTNTAFPYGNQRTAGSGVIYVRVQLLPKKELQVEKPVDPAPAMEKIFDKAQAK